MTLSKSSIGSSKAAGGGDTTGPVPLGSAPIPIRHPDNAQHCANIYGNPCLSCGAEMPVSITTSWCEKCLEEFNNRLKADKARRLRDYKRNAMREARRRKRLEKQQRILDLLAQVEKKQ